MSHLYNWTYASCFPTGRVRRTRRPNRYQSQPLKLLASMPTNPNHLKLLNHTGKILLSLVLISLTLVVWGKEPHLRAEVIRQVRQWWHSISAGSQAEANGRGYHLSKLIATDPAEKIYSPISPERKSRPRALLADQGMFWLDEAGKVWPLEPTLVWSEFPVITGVSVQERPGEMGVELQAQVNSAWLQPLLNVPFIDQISEIHFTAWGDIVLYTQDAIKILLPHPEAGNLARDLRRLAAVMEDIRVKQKKIFLIDLRYEHHIVVRPRQRR